MALPCHGRARAEAAKDIIGLPPTALQLHVDELNIWTGHNMIPPKLSAMHDALQALVNYVLQTRPSKKECKKCIGHGFLSHVKSQLDSCSQQIIILLGMWTGFRQLYSHGFKAMPKCTMLSVLQICRLKINHFPDFVSGPPMQYVPPASIDRLSQKSQKPTTASQKNCSNWSALLKNTKLP